MRKSVLKDKYYTHFDVKKHSKDYLDKVKDERWVSQHGFYPFIHFTIEMDKYIPDEIGSKYVKDKKREIYYSAHIDRYIYEYYGDRLNCAYNNYVKNIGTNKVSVAYRNNMPGKCNIHFAKDAFEKICKMGNAYVFVGDFTSFFDNLDPKYLKDEIKKVLGRNLNDAEYAIYKNLINFTYIEAEDIEIEKAKKRSEMRDLVKYFSTEEFQKFKTEKLKQKPILDRGIPQGSSISAVYANVYLIDFDKKINDYVTSRGGFYRRYCDDIIIAVPLTNTSGETNCIESALEYIFSIKDATPNLLLNKDKTDQFIYNAGTLYSINSKSKLLNYLGFTFDGTTVRIREKSLFKYYNHAYKKIRRVNEAETELAYIAGKKAVYESYTHLGNKKGKGNRGNFLSYAYKSHDIFEKSSYLKSDIRNQVKGHWGNINNRLNWQHEV